MIYHHSVAEAKIYFHNFFHRLHTRIFMILSKSVQKMKIKLKHNWLMIILVEIISTILTCFSSKVSTNGQHHPYFHNVPIKDKDKDKDKDTIIIIIIFLDAGTYICTADNGVGPPVTAIITCHVICEYCQKYYQLYKNYPHHHRNVLTFASCFISIIWKIILIIMIMIIIRYGSW